MADDTVRHKLTRAEAVAMIKKAPTGARFAVHIRGDAPVADNDDECYANALSVGLSISRNDALKIAKDCLSDTLERKGARVRVSVYTRTNDILGTSITYWLGG